MAHSVSGLVIIISQNSSKSMEPDPSSSNSSMIPSSSSSVRGASSSPMRPLSVSVVMNPWPSLSYTLKASFNSFFSVSSSTSETSPHPIMAGKADPYADIDFEEINEQTNLANDEIKCLKVCFDLFDTKKQEFLSADDLGEIMRAMGFRPTEEELKELLLEIDEDGSGEIV